MILGGTFSSTRFRPVCPSCGKELGHLEEPYKRLIEQGKTRKEAMDILEITNFCCRARTMCPIVLPLGGHYLPKHERSMEEYLQIKEKPPTSNLVIVSLLKSVKGETYIVSRTSSKGTIGLSSHEPTEIIIEDETNTVCPIRVVTEPGDIWRGITFESRKLRRDIDIDMAESFFDLPVETIASTLKSEKEQEVDEYPSDYSQDL